MNLFIDGHFVETNDSFSPGEELDHLVHADNVAGIEVYPSPMGVPVQYNNRGALCGVILIWTRRWDMGDKDESERVKWCPAQ